MRTIIFIACLTISFGTVQAGLTLDPDTLFCVGDDANPPIYILTVDSSIDTDPGGNWAVDAVFGNASSIDLLTAPHIMTWDTFVVDNLSLLNVYNADHFLQRVRDNAGIPFDNLPGGNQIVYVIDPSELEYLAIPEPSCCVLLAAGTLFLRRRKKA